MSLFWLCLYIYTYYSVILRICVFYVFYIILPCQSAIWIFIHLKMIWIFCLHHFQLENTSLPQLLNFLNSQKHCQQILVCTLRGCLEHLWCDSLAVSLAITTAVWHLAQIFCMLVLLLSSLVPLLSLCYYAWLVSETGARFATWTWHPSTILT